MLIQFVDVMFRNARRDGFVSFRVFKDNGKSERPVLIPALRLDDHEFDPLMLIPAEQAANWYEPAVFAPPVCTFKDHRNAKTDNILEGVALSVECDQSPSAGPRHARGPAGPGHRRGRERRRMDQRRDRRDREQGASALAAEEARGHGRGAGHAVRGALAGRQAGRRRPLPAISIVHPLRWPGQLALQEDAEAGADRGDLRKTPRSILRRRWSACARQLRRPGLPSLSGANGAATAQVPGDQREASDQSLVASTLAVIPNDST